MRKPLFLSLLLLTYFIQFGISQTSIKYKITDIDGYYFREISYDSTFNNYHYERIYIKVNKKDYPILENLNYVVRRCDVKIPEFKKNTEKEIVDCLEGLYFYDKRDSSNMNSPQIPPLNGNFYVGKDGKLYLGYFIKVKALLLYNTCESFEKNNKYTSICGTKFSKPYLHILKINSRRHFKKDELKKMYLKISPVKKINLIDCS